MGCPHLHYLLSLVHPDGFNIDLLSGDNVSGLVSPHATICLYDHGVVTNIECRYFPASRAQTSLYNTSWLGSRYPYIGGTLPVLARCSPTLSRALSLIRCFLNSFLHQCRPRFKNIVERGDMPGHQPREHTAQQNKAKCCSRNETRLDLYGYVDRLPMVVQRRFDIEDSEEGCDG
jgi:hypothetical protein